MLTLKLAQALNRHGIHVNAIRNGDDMQDGDVSVGEMVRVEVPTYGGSPRVVVDAPHADDDVRCYPPRTSVAELAHDIRDALDELPSSALADCSIH